MHIGNVFPIPENILTQMHKRIFNFIWQNKNMEPVGRKTIFLQKEKRGLNMKELEVRNLSMRLKHFLNLKQHEQ